MHVRTCTLTRVPWRLSTLGPPRLLKKEIARNRMHSPDATTMHAPDTASWGAPGSAEDGEWLFYLVCAGALASAVGVVAAVAPHCCNAKVRLRKWLFEPLRS